MSQATLPSPYSSSGQVPAEIVDKIRSLRRAIVAWLVVRGVAWLLAMAVLVAGVDLLLDWYFRMEGPLRAGLLVVMIVPLLIFGYRWLVRPLAQSLDDDTLCQRVEAQHEELGQSLISAVQFSRIRDVEPLGVSPSMVAATIAHGRASAGGLDFGDVLNDVAFRRNVFLGIAALVAVACAVTALPESMSIWFNRNILLGSERWPQGTYLEVQGVDGDRIVMPLGDDKKLVVLISEDSQELPEAVFLETRTRGRGDWWRGLFGSFVTRNEQMTKVGSRQFEYTFENVLEPFEFRVSGGDDTTQWYEVTLVPRPAVESLQLTLTPPAYTGLKPQPLPEGQGPYYIYQGSRLELAGTSNKELSRATLAIGDQTMELSCQGQEFRASLDPQQLVSGTYAISLVDTEPPDGLSSKRPTRFGIKQRADMPPVVKAQLRGISNMVVPNALVPVVCRFSDKFAVTSARIDWQVKADGGEQSAVLAEGSIPLEAIADQYGQAEIEYEFPFELSKLKLEPEQRLTFTVFAKDNNDVGGPSEGASEAFFLRIVTPDELRVDLLRRERELGRDFERLVKDQQDMHTDAQATAAAVRGMDSMADNWRKLLTDTQRKQHKVADRCARLAELFSELVTEVRNNRLEEEGGGKEAKLIDGVIEPLKVLAAKDVPEATDLLDQARRAASRQDLRDPSLTAAIAKQATILAEMERIGKNIITASGYQEVLNGWYAILKAQGGVASETEKAAKEKIRRGFSGSGSGAVPPPEEQAPTNNPAPSDDTTGKEGPAKIDTAKIDTAKTDQPEEGKAADPPPEKPAN